MSNTKAIPLQAVEFCLRGPRARARLFLSFLPRTGDASRLESALCQRRGIPRRAQPHRPPRLSAFQPRVGVGRGAAARARPSARVNTPRASFEFARPTLPPRIVHNCERLHSRRILELGQRQRGAGRGDAVEDREGEVMLGGDWTRRQASLQAVLIVVPSQALVPPTPAAESQTLSSRRAREAQPARTRAVTERTDVAWWW